MVHHFISLPYLRNVIVRNGLWCAQDLRRWSDTFDDDPAKWGSYGKAEEFSGYVSCSVNPPMGMMTRQKRPVILELDSSVLSIPGVLFVGRWSSFRDVTLATASSQTGVEWFDKMFLHPLANRAEPHPGEFLVPHTVPLRDVRGMVFFSQEDVEEAKRFFAGLTRPEGVKPIQVRVNPARFGRKMQEEQP